jgi:hypothetical protein
MLKFNVYCNSPDTSPSRILLNSEVTISYIVKTPFLFAKNLLIDCEILELKNNFEIYWILMWSSPAVPEQFHTDVSGIS